MPLTTEQLTARKRYLGGSDMAALFGLDPYKNAHDVYLDKTADLRPDKTTLPMELGNLFEPTLIKWAQGLEYEGSPNLGHLCVPVASLLVIDHLGGHPDATTDAMEPVEVKTNLTGRSSFNDKWGESGSADVPDHVNIQLHHYMHCLGAPRGHVVALLYGRGPVYYEVPRQDKVCDAIERTGIQFWKEHVERKVPPPNVLPNLDTLKRIVRVERKRVEMDALLFEKWVWQRGAAKAAAEDEKQSTAALVAALEDAEEATFGERYAEMVTYYSQTRRGVDTKKLLADHPELKAKYETTTTFPVLRTKKVAG